MSKYHPLDVRHPNNRDLERRNFLLDPPRNAASVQTPERDAASRPGVRKTAPQNATASATPWGFARRTPPAEAAGVTRPAENRAGRAIRLVFFLIVVAIALQSQTHLLDGLIIWAQQTAYDLGLWSPF